MSLVENEGNKKNILIVEDDALIRRALVFKFKHNDFNVTEAVNGEEGLSLALKEHPDIIILDIMMPVMDGLTMMQKLRQEGPWGKKVPIILMTNLDPDSDTTIKSVAENSPTFYLLKSEWDDIDKVVEKVRNL